MICLFCREWVSSGEEACAVIRGSRTGMNEFIKEEILGIIHYRHLDPLQHQNGVPLEKLREENEELKGTIDVLEVKLSDLEAEVEDELARQVPDVFLLSEPATKK